MSLCVGDGFACDCQPDEGCFCNRNPKKDHYTIACERTIAEMIVERDAAMKDAERYRWLRACRAGDWDALNNLRLAQSMCGLDTAIDAAIAKGKG